jgi:WD40 repeat protein
MALSHFPLHGDACLLAVADGDGCVSVLDPSARSQRLDDDCPYVQIVQSNGSAIYDIKWACDDSYVATASADGTLGVTNLAASRLVPQLILKSNSTSHIKTVACHPQLCTLLASGSRDGTLAVWDTRSRQVAMKCGIGGRDGTLRQQLALGICTLAPQNITPVKSIPASQSASSQGVRSLTGIDFVNDCCMMSCRADGAVCLWDMRNFARPILLLEAQNCQMRALACVRVAPCHTRAAMQSAHGYCYVVSMQNLNNAELCTAIPICPDPLMDFSFKLDWSPCGRFIACGGHDSNKTEIH